MKLFSILFFLWASHPLHAEILNSRTFPDGSSLEIEAPISAFPSGGFAPVRGSVENQSNREMTWDFSCTADQHSSYSYRSNRKGTVSFQFALTCPAKQSQVFDLLIPIPSGNGGGYEIRNITLNGLSKSHDLKISGNWREDYSDGSSLAAIAATEDLLSEYRQVFWDMRGSSHSSARTSPLADINAIALPEDWRAFAGYDAFFFSRKAYLDLTPGVKVALDQWVRSGGLLIVITDHEATIPGLPMGTTTRGLGETKVLTPPTSLLNNEPNPLREALKGKRDSLITQINTEFSGIDWSPSQALGKRTFQKGLLLFGLLIFAVIVGPINLYVLAGRDRRHRLFFTTPIISLVATLLLILVIILRDGFGGDGSRTVLVEIGGPDDHSAVIMQEQFARAGILFSSGFDVDDQTVLLPVAPPLTDFNRADSASSQNNFTLDITQTGDGWEYAGDLFESRAETAQFIRSVIPFRERLELSSNLPSEPQISSSFSATLTEVYYTDLSGEIWMASEIAPGATVTLQKTNSDQREAAHNAELSRFSQTRRWALNTLLSRPGSFIAQSKADLWIATHPSIDWQESPIVVTGLLISPSKP